MKKTLAILLSLALVICMIPATAFGTTTYSASVDKTSALYTGSGISLPEITVKNGNSSVTQNITTKWVNETGTEVTGTVTEAGIYKGTVTTSDSDTTISPSEFVFTVNKIDFNQIKIEYSGTGATLKNKFADFDTAAVGTTFATPSGATITVKQGNDTISSTFYTTEIKKHNADQICITVSPASNDNIMGGARFIYVTLTTEINSTSYKIVGTGSSGTIPDQTYNGGAALKPTVYVVPTTTTSGTSGSLKEGTDYTLEYTNNTSGGRTATVTATGIGKYSGNVSATFNIIGKNVSTLTITTNNTPKGAKPSFIIKDGSDKTLVEGTDYKVFSYDSTTVGTNRGTAVIEGMENYSDKRTVTYNVVDDAYFIKNTDVSMQYTASNPTYNGTSWAAPVIVKLEGTSSPLRVSVDYDLSYEITKNGKTTITTTAPKDAGTYQVYVIGKGSYATNGPVFAGTFTISPAPLDNAEIVLGSSTVLYGGVYVPKVTVRHLYNNTYFAESDYKVEYRYIGSTSSYLKPTAVVTAVEGGNLTATTSTKKELTKEFSLASRNLSNCTVTFTDSRTSKNYDGNASFKPPVTVKDYSINKTLTENLDYKITYKDAAGKVVYALKDAGTYSVIVEGINAYTGTKTLTFTINGTDISGYTVTLKEASVNATGYAQTPVILSVKKGVYSSLTSNDYRVTYQDATGKTVTSMSAPGTYKVVVTGKNGYSGSTYATFRIVGLPQTVTVNQDSYKVYTTSDSFKITAKATGDGTGFTYTSSNPAVASVSAAGYVTIHKVGRAVITVTTTGNKKYEPTSKDVTVKVYPSKAKISQKPSTDGKKAQMKVRWGYQDGVTKYQIRYSRDKNFKSGSYLTKTVKAHGKSYTTQSTTISNLKSGYTYYFKVRAVYTDPYTGDTYYGSWSPWRSAKTK